MIDEGYIKYNATRRNEPIPQPSWLRDLNMVRTTLWNMGLLGVYPNGIGFGNVSHRFSDESFIISGSTTGADMLLNNNQFALVESFDLEQNSVSVVGEVDASSESMSHGAIYRVLPNVNAVIHIHSKRLFDKMLELDYPHTPSEIAFGTPELAQSIGDLVKGIGEDSSIFVTAGHDEGIIAYGDSLDSAFEHIEKVYNNILEKKL